MKKLRRSEALYRAIGESIDYGIWVCAPDGRNIYASDSFLKLVGLTQQQCSDFGWGDVLHPNDAERTIKAWKECVRTEGVWDIEHRYHGVDGRWHPILARGVPVRDEKGQITCWAGINLDIGKLKDAQEALRKAKEELEEQTANLELAQTDGNIEIVVKDDGVGFDPTQIRGEYSTSGGFGLFSIRERISLLGGRMEIDSAPGQGSRFKLVIPLSAISVDLDRSQEIETQISTKISSRHQLKTRGVTGGIRIVLVDDHIIMRQELAGLLRSEPDFEIVGEASDGASAVKLVRELHPDVVLMDVSMPGMNGIESTQIIHREMPDVRVIGLSMFEEGEHATAMRDAGAVSYLTKSGPTEAVIEAIRECIHASGGQKQKARTQKVQ